MTALREIASAPPRSGRRPCRSESGWRQASSDAELLDGLLARSRPASRALSAGAALLARFGNLSAVLTATPEALALEQGVEPEDAHRLGLLYALVGRLAEGDLLGRPVISSWTALLAYVRETLRHETREHFRVLFLDKKNRLVRDETLGIGTIDHAPVYPREVVRRALELSASALILVHNHPSGDATPSQADVAITRQVVEAGRVLDLVVHDHLVVGGGEVASFKALGLI